MINHTYCAQELKLTQETAAYAAAATANNTSVDYYKTNENKTKPHEQTTTFQRCLVYC